MASEKGFNTQGWEQFLTYREDILNAFDRAKPKAKIRKVQTYHGEVVEAKFREFLRDFLPNKYEVTSGLVISQGAGDKEGATLYKRHSSISFKVLEANDKEIIVRALQDKNTLGEYLDQKELVDRTKDLFGEFLPEHSIHIRSLVQSSI